jgi:hypothetical protein
MSYLDQLTPVTSAAGYKIPLASNTGGDEKLITPADLARDIGAPSNGGDLFLAMSGQSNVVGVIAGNVEQVEITDSRVFVWNGTSWDTDGDVAVGAMLIHAAQKLAAERNVNVYCVVNGQGGTPISSWVGSGASSALYVPLKAEIEAALGSSEITALGKTKLDGFFWHQGESDAANASYYDNFVTLWNQLNAETWFDRTNTPVVLGQIATPRYGGDSAESGALYLSFSYDAISRLGRDLSPYVGVADSNEASLLADVIHFSANGMKEMGMRMAGVFRNLPAVSWRNKDLRRRNDSHDMGVAAGGSATTTMSLGYRAGAAQTTASNNVHIGFKAGHLADTLTNTVNIGYLAGSTGTANNESVNVGANAADFQTGIRNVNIGFIAGRGGTTAGMVNVGFQSGPAQGEAGFLGAVSLGFHSRADAAWQVMLGGSSHTQVKTAAPRLTLAGIDIRVGAGTPEAAVSAPVGSLFLRTDGAASTTLYIKETGTGNTGWVAK